MPKQYTKGTVTYGASGRRWKFNAESGFSYETPVMPGGRPTADKIAGFISGGLNRTGGKELDGLAHFHMADTFHKAAKKQARTMNSLGTYDKP